MTHPLTEQDVRRIVREEFAVALGTQKLCGRYWRVAGSNDVFDTDTRTLVPLSEVDPRYPVMGSEEIGLPFPSPAQEAVQAR